MLTRIGIVSALVARTILVFALALGLAGCGGGARGGKLSVVASTNVYADIARQIGGAGVSVTSVLTKPNADPHLFEPGTTNGLAVARAQVVIQNGLAYDSFMTRLARAAPATGRVTVDIADALGIRGADVNPHLWYDVPKLGAVAGAIAAGLTRADPAHGRGYARRLQAFRRTLLPLQRAVGALRAAFRGTRIAYTEAVPAYLTDAAGLVNLAPRSFTRPIEQGSEPSPAAVSTMVALAAQRRIKVLLYNEQAVSPITAHVRSAAQSAGIPVIGVTETLPAGETFQQWQLRQIGELRQALGA